MQCALCSSETMTHNISPITERMGWGITCPILRGNHVGSVFFSLLQNHSQSYSLLLRIVCSFSKVMGTKVTSSYITMQAFGKVWISSHPILTLWPSLWTENSNTAFKVDRHTGRKVMKVHRGDFLRAKYQETEGMRPLELRVMSNFEYMILSLKFLRKKF